MDTVSFLNTDPKFLSTDRSKNIASTTNWEPTNEIASPKKFIQAVKSKDFTRKRAQAIRSLRTNYRLLDETNKFDFNDSKMEIFW